MRRVENNYTPIFVPFKLTRNELGGGDWGKKFKNVPNLNVPFYGRGGGVN